MMNYINYLFQKENNTLTPLLNSNNTLTQIPANTSITSLLNDTNITLTPIPANTSITSLSNNINYYNTNTTLTEYNTNINKPLYIPLRYNKTTKT